MLFWLLDQQPCVILDVDITQQCADQPSLINYINKCLILACIDWCIVQDQHAYFLEFNVILRPIEHLVVQFAGLSAVVLILRQLVQDHVNKTRFILLEFSFILIYILLR